MILETERLRLRRVSATDLDFLLSMLGDATVMRFYPAVLDRAGAQSWLDRQLQRYDQDGFGFFLVEDRSSGEPMGQCGLAMQDVEGTLEPEIGYMFHPSFWGQGFATEAASGVRDWAFGNLNLPYVISLIRPVNLPSQGVAKRVGMSVDRCVEFKGYEHDVWRVSR